MDIENTIAQERIEKNRELLILAQAGDEQALEQLVVDNMALVRSVAIKFKDRGTEFEDLVQIGTIGMLKAIRSFEVERGTAFSTYAVPLIVGEIRKHLRDDGPIKVGREYKRMGALLLGERNRIMAQSGKTLRSRSLHSVAEFPQRMPRLHWMPLHPSHPCLKPCMMTVD